MVVEMPTELAPEPVPHVCNIACLTAQDGFVAHHRERRCSLYCDPDCDRHAKIVRWIAPDKGDLDQARDRLRRNLAAAGILLVDYWFAAECTPLSEAEALGQKCHSLGRPKGGAFPRSTGMHIWPYLMIIEPHPDAAYQMAKARELEYGGRRPAPHRRRLSSPLILPGQCNLFDGLDQ